MMLNYVNIFFLLSLFLDGEAETTIRADTGRTIKNVVNDLPALHSVPISSDGNP